MNSEVGRLGKTGSRRPDLANIAKKKAGTKPDLNWLFRQS